MRRARRSAARLLFNTASRKVIIFLLVGVVGFTQSVRDGVPYVNLPSVAVNAMVSANGAGSGHAYAHHDPLLNKAYFAPAPEKPGMKQANA
jgi:hypothetical protein